MDPLSDVLSMLKPRSYMAGGIDVGGDLSLRFSRYDGIKCYAVGAGQVWLAMEDGSAPIHLAEGDCFLLPRGLPFCLTSDPTLPSIDALELFRTKKRQGGVLTINGGGGCFIVGGHFALAGPYASALLESLPTVAHIRTESDRAAMRWSLDHMRQELLDPRPGGTLVAQQLATMMLVQALRLHLADQSERGVGWLFALADKQMAAALGAMHEEPGRRWTLQALAERAGMSRTSFTLKFKAMVGSSPMDYLTRWRMMLAGDRLTTTRDPISAIAPALGYESESAFGTAFKRVMGCSPRHYGRSATPAA